MRSEQVAAVAVAMVVAGCGGTRAAPRDEAPPVDATRVEAYEMDLQRAIADGGPDGVPPAVIPASIARCVEGLPEPSTDASCRSDEDCLALAAAALRQDPPELPSAATKFQRACDGIS